MIYTIFTLDNFYLSEEFFKSETPSRQAGVSLETEETLRCLGCELVQKTGVLLKLPQVAMATGQVLFHRFYCKKSMTKFNVKRVAAGCIWLASKLEECPRRLRDVLQVYERVSQRSKGHSAFTYLDVWSKRYEELKTDLVKTERLLLREMGFICHVEHPHKFVFSYLNLLGFNQNSDDERITELFQVAWNIANDSLRTTLCVRLKSNVVATAAVFLAARRVGVPLPSQSPWWELFEVSEKEMRRALRVMIGMYQRPKAEYVEVNPHVLESQAAAAAAEAAAAEERAKLAAAQAAAKQAFEESQPETGMQSTATPSGSKEGSAAGTNPGTQPLASEQGKETNDGRVRRGRSPDRRSVEREHSRDGGRARDRKRDHSRERSVDRGRDRDRTRDRHAHRDRSRDRDRSYERSRKRDRSSDGSRERDRSRDRDRDRDHDRDRYRSRGNRWGRDRR